MKQNDKNDNILFCADDDKPSSKELEVLSLIKRAASSLQTQEESQQFICSVMIKVLDESSLQSSFWNVFFSPIRWGVSGVIASILMILSASTILNDNEEAQDAFLSSFGGEDMSIYDLMNKQQDVQAYIYGDENDS